jgi:hypothetical protein
MHSLHLFTQRGKGSIETVCRRAASTAFASRDGITFRIADERGRVIDDIILPNQRIDRRNPGLRDEHQFEAERAPDVDERRRPRSAAASFNVVIAQPRYARIVRNTLLAITQSFRAAFNSRPMRTRSSDSDVTRAPLRLLSSDLFCETATPHVKQHNL